MALMKHIKAAAFAVMMAGGLAMGASAVEEPNYEIVASDDKIEVRAYASYIVAEITVPGDMRRASNQAFRPLFRYISGDNRGSDKIDMTAPVTRQPVKIDMTAPVTREATADGNWVVAFVMPDDWTMETLPEPNDPKVTLREVPERLMATIRFSGGGSERTFERKRAELGAWLATAGYRAVGEAAYAGYDAPYVPGPFRRNEVMIPVEAVQ